MEDGAFWLRESDIGKPGWDKHDQSISEPGWKSVDVLRKQAEVKDPYDESDFEVGDFVYSQTTN